MNIINKKSNKQKAVRSINAFAVIDKKQRKIKATEIYEDTDLVLGKTEEIIKVTISPK